ncbi:hypothetical protein [Bacillus subtilis]|uniref:hypothetical protein n=1 Tax=Bacillus subtilis TaxID=1423 RepID=UPI002DBBE992|nr:hypothetical protein [Bacillus subtilis]MEC1273331.1 hypothetical protein [Bacillus subtilis]MEC1315941.1 hypothetical protein [Bacillus subtilis]MEC1496215.1 hypothetical protein [Bacillus subtilis]
MGRHKATIEGLVMIESYYSHRAPGTERWIIQPVCKITRTEPIFEGYIDIEPIEIGGKVYIPGLNEYVIVTDRQRNIHNEWTYQTDRVVKTIIDEKSLKECEEHNNKKAKNNDTQNQRQIKTSWWKRLTKKD